MLPIPSGEIAIFEPSGESIDFIAEAIPGSCSVQRRSIRMTSSSATTRCTRAPRRCARGRRRFVASVRISAPMER